MTDDLDKRRVFEDIIEAAKAFSERPSMRQLARELQQNADRPDMVALRDGLRTATEHPEFRRLKPFYEGRDSGPPEARQAAVAKRRASHSRLREFVLSIADGKTTLSDLKAKAEAEFTFSRQLWRTAVKDLPTGKVRGRGATTLDERRLRARNK